jgi:hypothetical protein
VAASTWSIALETVILTNLGGVKVPKGRAKVEQRQKGYPLHVSVSNQSLSQTTADLAVILDGEQIFHREMTTGTQHSWEESTIPVAQGQHTLEIREARTNSSEERVVNVDRELWFIVTFQSPPGQIRVEMVDRPVGFM